MDSLVQTSPGSERSAPARQRIFGESRLAAPASVAHARHAMVAELAVLDLPRMLLDDIALAVSEACTNVVMHAYRPDELGRFLLTVDATDDAVHVCVSDDGAGLVPRPDSAGLGLGLPLIASLATSSDVTTNDSGRGTKVTMTFSRAGVTG